MSLQSNSLKRQIPLAFLAGALLGVVIARWIPSQTLLPSEYSVAALPEAPVPTAPLAPLPFSKISAQPRAILPVATDEAVVSVPNHKILPDAFPEANPMEIRPTRVVSTEKVLAAEGTSEAFIQLVQLLNQTSDGKWREDILLAAQTMQNRESAPLLLATLGMTDDWCVLDMAGQALANVADEAIITQILDRYFDSSNPIEQEHLLGVIRNIDDPRNVVILSDILMEYEDQTDDPAAKAVADALGFLGTPMAVEALLASLQQARGRPEAEEALTASLSLVSSPEGLPLLMEAALGEGGGMTSAVQCAAIKALGNYGMNPEIEGVLASVMATMPDPMLRDAVEMAMLLARGQDASDSGGW